MAGANIPHNANLHALVDMGSNGIRFSISNLSDSTARLIPTLYQSRSGISIYDAQFSDKPGTRVPIPSDTISDIISSLKSFTRTCQAFHVPTENIKIRATEATRTAPNSVEFRDQVKAATGITVELLSKADEGLVGALGIASSFPAPIKGIVLDLGGGSVQISWVKLDVAGKLQRSDSAVSLPYGAAAMMGRLSSGMKASDLSAEIEQSFRAALEELQIPADMLEKGLTLYLSGGGFRGWGYALMERHSIQPYPIPIINGFSVDAKQFDPRKVLAQEDSYAVSGDEFRISTRRASQSPAVALLISLLLRVLPKVSKIYFAQGGVREGSLFSLLPREIQSQHPLIAATSPYAAPGAESLAELISACIPSDMSHFKLSTLQDHTLQPLIQALASLLTYHGACPKDIRPSAALRSTTTGILASTHGLTHDLRAWLALALLARWGTTRKDLPKTDSDFYDGLSELLGPEEAWWAGYIGFIAGVVGAIYPAGILHGEEALWKGTAEWTAMGKKGKQGIRLTVDFIDDENVKDALKQLTKWGKKKKWEDNLVDGYKIEIEGMDEDASN